MARLPWELRVGTNVFGDDFCVLYAQLPIEQYVEAAATEQHQGARNAAQSTVGIDAAAYCAEMLTAAGAGR